MFRVSSVPRPGRDVFADLIRPSEPPLGHSMMTVSDPAGYLSQSTHERRVCAPTNSGISCIFLILRPARHVNFLGGSPLNRLSWLRTSSVFINTLIASTSTRWLAFHDGKPLMASRARESRLALLTTAEVEPFLGPKPYVGQGPSGSEGAIPAVDLPILEAARFRGAPIVFLGVNEPQANVYCPTVPPEEFAKTLVGTPFFSIDLSQVDQTGQDRLMQTSAAATDGFNLSFDEARSALLGMDEFHAGVFAEARSMVDWNSRNKVCSIASSCSTAHPPLHSVLCFLWFTRILYLGRMETVMRKPPLIVR